MLVRLEEHVLLNTLGAHVGIPVRFDNVMIENSEILDAELSRNATFTIGKFSISLRVR
jgi:hypothetical protein